MHYPGPGTTVADATVEKMRMALREGKADDSNVLLRRVKVGKSMPRAGWVDTAMYAALYGNVEAAPASGR
jgi:hypothetical protein